MKDCGKYAQRQQKCLSHPSYSFSHSPLTNQIALADETCSGGADQNTNETSLQGTTSTLLNSDIDPSTED